MKHIDGVSGEAVIVAARLVEAPDVQDAIAMTQASLDIIASARGGNRCRCRACCRPRNSLGVLSPHLLPSRAADVLNGAGRGTATAGPVASDQTHFSLSEL
jgi:hypothetical protein